MSVVMSLQLIYAFERLRRSRHFCFPVMFNIRHIQARAHFWLVRVVEETILYVTEDR